MAVVGREPFDRGDLCAIECADRHRTGTHRAAVDMHGAGATLRDTAAEFRASQTDHVAQHPEKRRIGLDIYLSGCFVDFDRDHLALLRVACRLDPLASPFPGTLLKRPDSSHSDSSRKHAAEAWEQP